MSKKIVICTDGTWNKPNSTQKEALQWSFLKKCYNRIFWKTIPTNVEKIYRAISCDDVTQSKYYDSGVGTGNFLDMLVGGITGKGLDDKIKKAYTFIVNKYVPGDELYLFGFSRGAYTARSLAGLIRNVGIVKDVKDVDKAFNLYRDRSPSSHPDSGDSLDFRRKYSYRTEGNVDNNDAIPRGFGEGDQGAVIGKGNSSEQSKAIFDDHVIRIKFIGVWDTVGALGIPTPFNLFSRLTIKKYRFHDITLTSTADHAYHAIAVDERRKKFTPSIWDKSCNMKYGSNKYVQQMWFSGVHSNIGGGYVNAGLSDITLHWLVNKARHVGLQFDYTPCFMRYCSGKLYDSKTFIYQFSEDYVRKITLRDEMPIAGAVNTINPDCKLSFHEYIHYSVYDRIGNTMCKYEPINVFQVLNMISTSAEADRACVS